MIIYTVEDENYSHCQTENHFSERQPVFKETIYKLNQIPKLFNHIGKFGLSDCRATNLPVFAMSKSKMSAIGSFGLTNHVARIF